MGRTNTPDMAIVELNRRVDFVPDMVGPICVPPSEMFDDRPKDAYVAGNKIELQEVECTLVVNLL